MKACLGLVCSLLLSVPKAPAAEVATNTVTPCVHLSQGGQNYSVTYFGHKCRHQGYTQLPEGQYDTLASWTFNASYAGFLSQFDRYRILARLATLDSRGAKGFAHGPCNFGPWADYKWAEHAAQAFYGVSDALGDAPVVTDSLINPILKLRLAQKDRHMVLEFKDSTKLSDAKRARLVVVFLAAESNFSKQTALSAAPLTLDQAAKAKPKYESARRKTFEEFSVLHD